MIEINICKKIFDAKQGNKESMLFLIDIFNPLINKYARKLSYLDFEDAKGELTLRFIEIIYSMKRVTNNYESIAYIQKLIFCFFCQSYAKKKQLSKIIYLDEDKIVIYQEESEAYEEMIFTVDFLKSLSKCSMQMREIIILSFNGFSDREIANRLSISRQYVNRIKKKLTKYYIVEK